MKVGFIGLGVMGRPMALHLHKAGHELWVWARRPEKITDFPATVCATPAELGRQCAVVFTVVTSSQDVETLALGDNSLSEGLAPDSVLIDCSTIAPESARHIAAELGKKGIHFLDAPVSGGAQGAIDATLAIMAGGDAAVLERVRPLLECLGKRIVHIGPNGAGQVAKACNQMIMVAAIEAIAEAILHSKGINKIKRYPGNLQQEALFDAGDRKQQEEALAWARQQGVRYALSGAVDEWRYKVGVDGEPAAGVAVQIIDVASGDTLWSGAGGKSGWSREALSSLARQLLRDLLLPAISAHP